jgi:hypothetical protein
MSTTNEELAHLERTGIELSECDPDFVDGKYVCVCERVRTKDTYEIQTDSLHDRLEEAMDNGDDALAQELRDELTHGAMMMHLREM